jgi:PAS domain-containing protein
VHKLFAKQLAKATEPSGMVDLDLLGQLVSAAFEETDRDRRRTDRSIALMIEELDRLNAGLERTITERTGKLYQREAELLAQNQRFDAAINNMLQGLCMFDRDRRLVVCNAQYASMYGLSDDQVQVGTTLRSILESRVASGNCPEDTEGYIKGILEEVDHAETSRVINELRDGGLSRWCISPCPMEGGLVCTRTSPSKSAPRRRLRIWLITMRSPDCPTAFCCVNNFTII